MSVLKNTLAGRGSEFVGQAAGSGVESVLVGLLKDVRVGLKLLLKRKNTEVLSCRDSLPRAGGERSAEGTMARRQHSKNGRWCGVRLDIAVR